MPDMNPIEVSFREAQDCLSQFISDTEQFPRVQLFADKLATTFQGGGKAMSCGNGGSMSDAMHFAEEWSGRYRYERPPLPAIGVATVGLLGKGGGRLLPLCDIPIIVPGNTSDRIQELHIKIIHIVIETVERELFPQLY